MKGAIDTARAFELAAPEERLRMMQLAFDYAIAALKKQQPLPVDYAHQEGAPYGRVVCLSCGHSRIINWAAYLEFQRTWYCKDCGQLCLLDVD